MLGKGARRAVWAAWLLLGIAAQVTASAQARTILVMGDSLSAGYGMRITQSWVTLLEQRLRKEGYEYAVVNASVSGETSAGGRARLPRALQQHQPAIVIIELGANDALRGLPIANLRSNLDTMISQAKQANAQVLLLGMRMPPNYGEQYSAALQRAYSELAAQHGIRSVPFFLDKVALDPQLMQDDQMHPAVEAQPLLLDNVWPQLEPLLNKSTIAQTTGD
jgi:acyl-CoA thioesterase-1